MLTKMKPSFKMQFRVWCLVTLVIYPVTAKQLWLCAGKQTGMPTSAVCNDYNVESKASWKRKNF